MKGHILKGLRWNLNLGDKLTKKEKSDLIKLISRIAEDSYRRGVQQSNYLTGKGLLSPEVLRTIRFDSPNLDKSPDIETGKSIYADFGKSRKRLIIEYGTYLRDVGISEDEIE